MISSLQLLIGMSDMSLCFYSFVTIWMCASAILCSTQDQDVSWIDPSSLRIVGGQVAQAGRWPFFVTLRTTGKYGKEFEGLGAKFCGGSIISADTILTAAHCVSDQSPMNRYKLPPNLYIYLGQNDTSRQLETSFKVFVDRIIIHPNHTKRWPKDDLAILKLNDTIDIGGSKGASDRICLPGPGVEPDGARCIALGMGQTSSDGPKSQELLQVSVPLNKCSDNIRSDPARLKLCSDTLKGQPRRGTCKADSGGPIVCPLKHDPDVWLLFGVHRSGKPRDCGVYSSFTRVSAYVSWIVKTAHERKKG